VQHDLARTIQSVLFVSAINTLLQTYFGARLPVVMGNSFYFLPILLSIVERGGIIDIPDPHEVLLLFSSGIFFLTSFLSIRHSLTCRCISREYRDVFLTFGSVLQRFLRGMRATQGAFIAGSALNIILGFSGLWGITMR
jgi:xanthine/uracil permease